LYRSLVDLAAFLNPAGGAFVSKLVRDTLLRPPFVHTAAFGYPMGPPRPTESPLAQAAGAAVEAVCAAHAVCDVLWDIAGSTALDEDPAAEVAAARFVSLFLHYAQVPGFVEHAVADMLACYREDDIQLLLVEAHGSEAAMRVRAYLLTHAPDALWSICPDDAEAQSMLVRDSLNAHPRVPLGDDGLQHRLACLGLAKLRLAAAVDPVSGARPSGHAGQTQSIALEWEAAEAQREFLPLLHAQALSVEQTVRALLAAAPSPATRRAAGAATSSTHMAGESWVAAARLAQQAAADIGVRDALLQEALRRTCGVEREKFIDLVRGGSVAGEEERKTSLEKTITGRLLKASSTLAAACTQRDPTIVAATDSDYAAALFEWQALLNSRAQ
jgi:hypothetical protein